MKTSTPTGPWGQLVYQASRKPLAAAVWGLSAGAALIMGMDALRAVRHPAVWAVLGLLVATTIVLPSADLRRPRPDLIGLAASVGLVTITIAMTTHGIVAETFSRDNYPAELAAWRDAALLSAIVLGVLGFSSGIPGRPIFMIPVVLGPFATGEILRRSLDLRELPEGAALATVFLALAALAILAFGAAVRSWRRGSSAPVGVGRHRSADKVAVGAISGVPRAWHVERRSASGRRSGQRSGGTCTSAKLATRVRLHRAWRR